jgi:glycosyltransferase involved in cell wall biosynthesis
VGFGGGRTSSGRLLFAAGAAAAGTVTALSRWHAEVLRARLGPERPIAIAHLGVDLRRFGGATGPAPRHLGSDPLLLAVGSLLPVKGHAPLIEALPILIRRLPPALRGVRLRIVGDGPERAALAALISRLGLGARVELAGEVPYQAMPAQYAAADLFVHASHYESQCLSLLEALACGLPVVSTPVGLAPELLADGGAGELAAGPSPEALASALERLLLRAEPWPELSAKARRVALPYAVERTTDEWLNIYRELLA